LNDNLVDFHLKVQTTDSKESKLFGGGGGGTKSSEKKENSAAAVAAAVVDPETLKKDVHVFSSHFYTKLHEEPFDKKSQKTKVLLLLRIIKLYISLSLSAPLTHAQEAAYERVERWTRGVDIFAKKYVFFPIVENLHWSLVLFFIQRPIIDHHQPSSSTFP
jgi:hypothetical protein